MRLRHLDYPPGLPVESWGPAGLEALLDRGDLRDWAPLLRAVATEPDGALADEVVRLLRIRPMYGTSALWRRWVEERRTRGSPRETLVGIVLYEGADLLDAGGPYEVFLTASRLAVRAGGTAPFHVVMVGVDIEPVSAYGGVGLIPQAALDDVDLDVLVVPGTIALDRVLADGRLHAALRAATARTALVTSVCTGAFLLGALGLLDDRPWTTHWEDVDPLAERVRGKGARAVRWVDAGSVVTSAGLSSGIAMALHLVDRLAGRDLAERTARQLDYDWDPAGRTGDPP